MRFLNGPNYEDSSQRKSTELENTEDANIDVESSCGSQTETQTINKEKGGNNSSNLPLDFFGWIEPTFKPNVYLNTLLFNIELKFIVPKYSVL